MTALIVCTPISDRLATMFATQLAAHDNAEDGLCPHCRVPSCDTGRQARFELVMAGRLPEPLFGLPGPT